MTDFAAMLPPGLLLVLGGLLIPLLPRGPIRKAYLVLLPVLGLVMTALIPEGTLITREVFDYTLTMTRVDAMSRVFGIIFHIAALLSVIFALHDDDTVQQVAGITYAGSAIAATFAGDLISLFIFWEATAITSVFLIWARRTERAFATGMRYLIIQVASGVLLLAGTIIHFRATGSLDFGTAEQPFGMFAFETFDAAGPGIALIFLSFGIKAAFPLLHTWLPDAYPESTETGSVWLSSFTTKLAIYALARGFAGTDILIPLGATMAVFPMFYAVIENDMRKMLAYTLNNQLGYMVVGVGIGTELALNGTAAHAFAHIIYKGLLFMAMGAVLYRVGTAKASELGGLWRNMRWTAVFCIVAGFTAFPLTSGFVTKSMIITAAAEGHHTVAFLVLTFATAVVFHQIGLRLPYVTFFGRDRGFEVKEAPVNMLIAMGIAAAMCIGIGVFPQYLWELLPYDYTTAMPDGTQWVAYDTTHVLTALQLLTFSALVFVVQIRKGWYPAETPAINLDAEWLYRRLGRQVGNYAVRFMNGWRAILWRTVGANLKRAGEKVQQLHAPATGVLGEPWAISEATLLAAVMLVTFLILAFF